MSLMGGKSDIVIIGAGASGLMAGRVLAEAGKKVVILEARDRIGGRIWPLPKDEFGYNAQGGAEFVHGKAPVTKALAKEAGVTLTPTEGDMWNVRDGEITVNERPVQNQGVLYAKLKTLEKDMPIAEFFDKYFPGDEYRELRGAIFNMVEGYDAADPKRVSTFALRDEWLGNDEWLQYRIKEGYGVLLEFLRRKCVEHDADIQLNKMVTAAEINSSGAIVRCGNAVAYQAKQVIVTVPLPLIKKIAFTPAIPKKLEAAEKIGYGGTIKLLLRFKDRWWAHALGKDFDEMGFMISNQQFGVWWTQYPNVAPVLVGWLGGPRAQKFAQSSSEEILETSIESLANIFKMTKERVKGELVHARVFNWPADPLSLGAYSYTTPETESAQEELLRPVDNKIFFAGEALYEGKDASTVEGAFASGKEVALKILAS